MGDVIPFTRTGLKLYAASRQLGAASRGVAASAELLQETRKHLLSAESQVRRAVAKLDKCQELLDWTSGFCRRCLAAADLEDVEEMVRQRDELAEVREQQAMGERSMKTARSTCAQ
jgi:hypothetical protein